MRSGWGMAGEPFPEKSVVDDPSARGMVHEVKAAQIVERRFGRGDGPDSGAREEGARGRLRNGPVGGDATEKRLRCIVLGIEQVGVFQRAAWGQSTT